MQSQPLSSPSSSSSSSSSFPQSAATATAHYDPSRIQSWNPHTGQLLKQYDFQSDEHIEAVLQSSLRAFHHWRAPHMLLEQRVDAVRRLASTLLEHKRECATVMSTEMGKPFMEAIAEIEKCALNCTFYAENGPGFLQDSTVKTDASISKVLYEPLGPILQLAPFNFPFWQVFRFVAPAIIAGNTTIIRHGHSVPQSAELIQHIANEAFGGPTLQGLLQVIFVDHDQVSRLIADPRIRGVTLTGSTRVGSIVAEQAARHIKKTVLELGGSDPFIVCSDVDIELSVTAAMGSRLNNNGQSCIAAKRFIVESAVLSEFTSKFVERMQGVRLGDPFDPNVRIGPLARRDLRDNVHNQVLKTVAQGGELLCGGTIPDTPGFHYPATVIANVKPGMEAFDNEIFGPVASIIEARNVDEAVEFANRSQYGLGGAVFTRDTAKGERIARKLESGMAFVNGIVKSDPRMPFGGTKKSGYGRECGREGVLEWVNAKTLWIK